MEVCFIVSDLEKAEEDLRRNSFSFRTSVWPFGKDTDAYGGGYAAIRYVEDPDGVQVELMQIVEADK